MLYERHNYLNKNILFLTSREIVEYDIQSAGFNILKKYKLVSNDKISYLESLGKKERQIQIGLYQRENKNLVKDLNDKFKEIRKIFFESNNLSNDDVLSIKKDAIITLKRCHNVEFDNILFVEKNYYSSYYYLNEFEFYVGNNIIDVKGISDYKLEKHRDYMLNFLYIIFKMMETTSSNIIAKNIKDFAMYYKTRQLDTEYYRELDRDSLFTLLNTSLFNKVVKIESVGDAKVIDIGYNYLNYVIPLVNLII